MSNVVWINGRNSSSREVTAFYGNLWLVQEEYPLTRKIKIRPSENSVAYMNVSMFDDPDYEVLTLGRVFEKLIDAIQGLNK